MEISENQHFVEQEPEERVVEQEITETITSEPESEVVYELQLDSTPEPVVSEPEPEQIAPEPATAVRVEWYVSSHHSSKYYYHESCDGWQDLSPRYLKSFATEAELKAAVPGRELHHECNPS